MRRHKHTRRRRWKGYKINGRIHREDRERERKEYRKLIEKK